MEGLPVKSRWVGAVGRIDRCPNQGLDYAQRPKRGQVASGGNVAPFPRLLGLWRLGRALVAATENRLCLGPCGIDQG